MAEGRQSKLIFNISNFSHIKGNEWINRLTTTDGLEITVDPLLLEADSEDQAARNDR